MNSPIRVALVEDDAGLRETLEQIVGRAPDFRVCGAYGDGESAVKHLVGRQPDLILMDIRLPGMSGIECLRKLKARLPRLRAIMLTVCSDNDNLFEAFAAGADGYLLKSAPRLRLLESMRETVEGGSPVSPRMARRIIDYFQKTTKLSPVAAAKSAAATVELQSLTTREQHVLAKLAEGLVTKEIATAIGISRNTVRNIATSIYSKLRVHSRSEAILKFLNGNGARREAAK